MPNYMYNELVLPKDVTEDEMEKLSMMSLSKHISKDGSIDDYFNFHNFIELPYHKLNDENRPLIYNKCYMFLSNFILNLARDEAVDVIDKFIIPDRFKDGDKQCIDTLYTNEEALESKESVTTLSYYWALSNWGCRGSAIVGTTVIEGNEINFVTAWSTISIKLFNEIIKKYSKVLGEKRANKIKLYFSEPGNSVFGKMYIGKDGKADIKELKSERRKRK